MWQGGKSRKDFLRSHLLDIGCDVTITSRPLREGEVDGVSVCSVSKEEFKTLIVEDKLFLYTIFNDWYYGISNKSWKENRVFVMSPRWIKSLCKRNLEESFIVHLNIDSKTRKERLSKRNVDSAERRLKADEEDFKDFDLYNRVIVDPFFSGEKMAKELKIKLL